MGGSGGGGGGGGAGAGGGECGGGIAKPRKRPRRVDLCSGRGGEGAFVKRSYPEIGGSNCFLHV